MAGKLVTVATFDRVSDAHLARGALEAAGIKAAIAEEDTSPILGQYVTATSGIRLSVLEEDEERAVKVLDETFEQKPLTEAELAAQAEAAAPEDAGEGAPAPASDPVADLAAREKEAQFALKCACLAWLFPPIGLPFTLLMILQAANGPGKLGYHARGNLYTATMIVFAPVVLGVIAGLLYVALQS